MAGNKNGIDSGAVIALITAFAPEVDPEIIEAAVESWLDDHPEATTTVEDGSITAEKLASALAAKIAEIDDKYEKPSGGIPSTDLADSYIEEPSSEGTSGQVLTTDGNGGRTWTTVQGGGGASIDDTAGEGDTTVVWSADKTATVTEALSSAIVPLTPAATSGDVGKFLKAKTVSGGKVTEYEFGSGGGSAEIAGTSSDIGKALSPKTVVNNVVTEWQYLDPAPKWELINEETFTNATSATKAITVDSYGEPIELTDIVLMFETPKQATDSAKTSPIVTYYNNNAKNIVTYVTAWTQAANAAANGCFVFVENHDGLVISKARQKSVSTSGATAQYFYQEGFAGSDQGIVFVNDFAISKVEIRGVTGTGHYVLYGKRKAQ